MTRRGYDPGFAVGTVAGGGTLGIMIPPSITFVTYGILTETSIPRLPRDRCHHPRHDGGYTRQRYH
jgi:TRAP-type mannitol/chloroaromatic compound transport system permease large subunit